MKSNLVSIILIGILWKVLFCTKKIIKFYKRILKIVIVSDGSFVNFIAYCIILGYSAPLDN